MKINLENTYGDLLDQFYQKRNPDQVKNPKLIKYNAELAEELNINLDNLSDKQKAEYFSGNKLFKNSQPIAQVYAGHQFGHFSPRLGDGRAILLGEILDKNNNKKDIVLKGSGETIYSRGGDGKASLGSVIREYIMSEAMHKLGIPTSRSLAVVSTGEKVFRENILPGGILCRVASSHIRFGTFEYFFHKGDFESVKNLADYSIARHYLELEISEKKYADFVKYVMLKQIGLVVDWMRVGFIHGVMNTDNMLISGETIDYGPCAFMDNYNKNTVFSSIDQNSRYSFINQRNALHWNLYRFGETLIPLLSEDVNEAIKILENILNNFDKYFDKKYFTMMNNKIGIFQEELFDNNLVQEILEFLEKNNIDYTDFFRNLGKSIGEEKLDNFSEEYNYPEAKNIFEKLENILDKQDWNFDEISVMMKEMNPSIIPRNYKVENAINGAEQNNDFTAMENLCDILKNPYTDNQDIIENMKAPEFVDKNYKTYCGM